MARIRKTFILIFVLLIFRLIQLQLVEGRGHRELAMANAAKTVKELAPRGLIYDRRGKALAENRPAFSLHILPHILARKSPAERQQVLRLLGRLLGREIIYKISATAPIIIENNIPLAIAIQIEELKQDLPGVVVVSQPIRLVKYNGLAPHVIGYVGQSDNILNEIVGKDGLEKEYDSVLKGRAGGKKIEVDVYGQPLRVLESLDPVPGADIKLTLDAEMQAAAEKALGAKVGAVVALDPQTGEILAMASYPNYDPNRFVEREKGAYLAELSRRNHPFINRALAIYPPGSIFKPIVLIAALAEKVTRADEVINCTGVYKINNRYAKCWKAGGHGVITVPEGLVWSCDTVFYELGRRLGPDTLAKYARKFGLGSYSNIDLPQEKKGTVPDKAWKEKYLQQPWFAGDSINYGIGQGFVEVTPLQMALVYAGLATGSIPQPYLVENREKENRKQKKLDLPEETLAIVRSALNDVVDRGTGLAVRSAGISAAGKTGTAENPGRAHAWFIGYAPTQEPQVVVAAFVAHGEHGDKASAYVVRDVLKWFKENRLSAEAHSPSSPLSQRTSPLLPVGEGDH